MADVINDFEQLGSRIDDLTDVLERIEFALEQLSLVGESFIEGIRKQRLTQAQGALTQVQLGRRNAHKRARRDGRV